jgi:hypothetical protein
MSDTELLNFMEQNNVDFFKSCHFTVALLRHYNPMAFHYGSGINLRAAVADLIAKNPALQPKPDNQPNP